MVEDRRYLAWTRNSASHVPLLDLAQKYKKREKALIIY